MSRWRLPDQGPAAVRPQGSPVDCGKQGMKRSGLADGHGVPQGRVVAPANCHNSLLLALDILDKLCPLPDLITAQLDAGYDSVMTRAELDGRNLTGEIGHKGKAAPVQAGPRWPIKRTRA
jgi:hypothetical protein